MDSIDDKLDKILANQQDIYNMLTDIVKLIKDVDSKAFLHDYLANIAGVVTAEVGLNDLIRGFKK